MAQIDGLNRRAFLQNAGMTALLGALGTGTSTASEATGAASAPPANGKYDFDAIYNRFGTDSIKFDQQIRTFGKDSIEVGMGIADMDFRAAPVITRALTRAPAARKLGLPGHAAFLPAGRDRLEQATLRCGHQS